MVRAPRDLIFSYEIMSTKSIAKNFFQLKPIKAIYAMCLPNCVLQKYEKRVVNFRKGIVRDECIYFCID
jgi:hypothetical protein